MRLTVMMETGDERYAWVNKAVVIASSARCGNQGEWRLLTMLIFSGLRHLPGTLVCQYM
jgi:hypothetical protein